MMRPPTTSIVMPTYHQHQHIGDAIAGLQAQTDQDFELIIVQDGSDSLTADQIDKSGIFEGSHHHCWMQFDENRGTAIALNAGFERASGHFWTWVSSDNVMEPDWLSKLSEILRLTPSVDAVYSSYYRESGKMWKDGWEPQRSQGIQNPYHPLIESLNCFIGPSFLYRRGLATRVGEHRGAISHDYDWWLRAEEHGAIAHHPDFLATYRAHGERATVVRADQFDAQRWKDEALARRRKKLDEGFEA